MATTDNTTTEVLKHGAKFTYSEPNAGYNDKRQTYELYVSFTTEDLDGVVEAAEKAFTLAKATVFEQAGVPFTVETTDNGVKVNPTFPVVAATPKQQAPKPFPQNGGGSKFGSAPKPFGGGKGGYSGASGGFPPAKNNPTKQDIGEGFTIQQSQKSGKWYITHPDAQAPDPRKPGQMSAVLVFVDDPNGVTADVARQLMEEKMAAA